MYLGAAEDVDALVRNWRVATSKGYLAPRTVAAETPDAYTAAGRALREVIWDPVASEFLHLERVFVVPDGSLNLVNLTALPSGRETYLVETASTLHLLSAERDLLRAVLPPRGEGLLVIGAPDFEDSLPFSRPRARAPTSKCPARKERS